MPTNKNRKGGAYIHPNANPDFYETPRTATTMLLRHEDFTGHVFEPAAGRGAILKVLEEFALPYAAADINPPDKSEFEIWKGDFLNPTESWQTASWSNIITNPPYNRAEAFIDQALKTAQRKVAFLLRLGFLEGQRRFKNIYGWHAPVRVWVFPNRLTFTNPRTGKPDQFTYAHAWFVWDCRVRNNAVSTDLRWFDPEEYKAIERGDA